jgi:galactokinase
MDQYSTAMGYLIYLESKPKISIQSLNPNLGTFVLGDSNEPKDTMGILARCRDARLTILDKLKKQNTSFSLYTSNNDFKLKDLTEEEKTLFHGTIKNRDFLKYALLELEKNEQNHKKIGELLSDHHAVLRDVLNVSTPKIEAMLEAAMDAGALGGKINGSGGGGCMVAYVPENPQQIAEAIQKAGGKAYIIDPDEGTRID